MNVLYTIGYTIGLVLLAIAIGMLAYQAMGGRDE